jgi:hypothetical protein
MCGHGIFPYLSRLNTKTLVAISNHPNEGNRDQNHPRFAYNLAAQKLERAESQVQEDQAVDYQADEAIRSQVEGLRETHLAVMWATAPCFAVARRNSLRVGALVCRCC